MEVVYLKSQGLAHHDICRLSRISENTLRAYLAAIPGGGRRAAQADRLRRDRQRIGRPSRDVGGLLPQESPPLGAQAADDIERLTGIRRGQTQVRKFLGGMGMKFRKLGMIPAKADAEEQAKFLDEKLWPRLKQAQRLKRVVCFGDAAHFVHGPFLGYLWCFVRLLMRGPSGRKRFNVLGAIDAVTHELTTVCNETTINAQAIGELLGEAVGPVCGLADHAGAGQRPLPELCRGAGVGPLVEDRVAVPAAILAEPEPDRAAVEVRQEGMPVLPVS